MKREDYIAQNAAVGTWYRPQPEFLEDVDGMPLGISLNTCEFGYNGGTIVTRAELAAVGLTPEDVPNLTIIEPRTTEK